MERLGSIHDRIETVSESPRPVGEAVEQDGTVSYPSFAHMHQPNSSTTPDNDAYHAWKLAQPEGAGHQLHANQHHHAVFAENPAGQGSSAQTASGAKATTVGSMLRRELEGLLRASCTSVTGQCDGCVLPACNQQADRQA